MSESLRNVWQAIEHLLDQGINLIPVRDKDQVYKGKIYEAKTPYAEWKTYQYEKMDRAILFDQMANKFDTTAVAMVCGAISGNLEVIDFDTKYYPGIDATVLSALRELYPDIFSKLKRHRTRSGGLHLVYRIADHEVPASTHLANRLKTQAEVDANPANKKKYVTYIETRGTGALATAPPSLGYEALNDGDIQTITWEERCTVVEFCRVYNEYFAEQKDDYKPPKSELNYYDENPFEHYNRTVDAKELFEQYGWTYVRKHGHYIWFTRPGGRRGEVHAGYNTATCTYRVWGTKADLDSERSYTPATILAHYMFNGDKSATYAYLVAQGYGRIKPHIEQQIARRRATQGIGMPTNASQQAVEQYTALIEESASTFPHGIFWEEDDDGKIVISRYKWNAVATALGFRLYNDDIVQIVERFIHRRDLRYFFDCMRSYIKHDNQEIYEEIYNSAQLFIEKHGKFESTQMDFLQTEEILIDTRSTCYKFYQNGYVHISAQGYTLLEYGNLDGKLIWYEKIQPRQFNKCNNINNGLYIDFLNLACNLQDNKDHIMRVLGYLAHDYKDETTGYIITLIEQCADPKEGGGSGKNLFCNLLKLTTTYKSVPGAQIQFNEKFLQSWNGERLFAISDAEKNFKFTFLKELSTGEALVKKLFKNDETFDVASVPKFIIQTNYSYDSIDGGLKRRIIAVEFTDFFTKNDGIDGHYQKRFPTDWQQEDYDCYDNFICQSIQLWIQNKLKLTRKELTNTSWLKQFELAFGEDTFDFIEQHFNDDLNGWLHIDNAKLFNSTIQRQYDEYMNKIGRATFKVKFRKLNSAIEDYIKRQGYRYIKDNPPAQNGLTNKKEKYNRIDAPF